MGHRLLRATIALVVACGIIGSGTALATATPLPLVTGVLRTAAGQPVTGVGISFVGGGATTSTTTTAVDGSYSLSAATGDALVLTSGTLDDATLRSLLLPAFDLTTGATTITADTVVDLTLPAPVRIDVAVAGPSGAVDGANVGLPAGSTAHPVDAAPMASGLTATGTTKPAGATTGPAGTASLFDFPNAGFGIQASHTWTTGLASSATGTVGSTTGQATASLALTLAGPPPAPTALTATPADGALSLNWTAPTDGGSVLTGSTVTASAPGATPPQGPVTVVVAPDATTATVPGLVNGIAYTVVVHATNAYGDGPDATTTETPNVPPTPRAAVAVALTTTISNGSPQVTATVAPASAGSTVPPTGTVTFEIGTIPVAVPLVAAQASTLLAGVVARTSIRASYAGDDAYLPGASGALVTPTLTGSTSVASPQLGDTANIAAALATDPAVGVAPGGSVRFAEGATTIATVDVVAGSAATGNLPLGLGTHIITIEYVGDAAYTAATTTVTTTVALASPGLQPTSSANPSVFGSTITLGATLTGRPGVLALPTGTVTFREGTTVLAAAAVADGAASLTTSTLAAGTHDVQVEYSGDAAYAPVTVSLSQVVSRAPVVTTVGSSLNPSTFGQAVTFTAAVTSGGATAGVPTGTFTFSDGTTALATVPVALDGTATFTAPALTGGAHTIGVSYVGDVSYLPGYAAITQTANRTVTTLAGAGSPTTAGYGQTANLTATLGAGPVGAVAPNGTVRFYEGQIGLGVGAVVAGRASAPNNWLVVGTHQITVEYSGDLDYLPASAQFSLVIVPATPTVTITSSIAAPAGAGATTLQIAVAAPGFAPPSGTVSLTDNGATIATAPLAATTASGTATVTTTFAPGPHAVVATYGGDASFTRAVSPTLHAPGTSITASANLIPFGQATVVGTVIGSWYPFGPAPTGNVVFGEGATTLATVGLWGGRAAYRAPALTGGTHTLWASYPGDRLFLAVALRINVVVNPATPTIAASANLTRVVTGAPVVLLADVLSDRPFGTVPTGTVTFRSDLGDLGSSALGNGRATLTSFGLSPGTRTITAQYNGDGSYTGRSSSFTIDVVAGVPATHAEASRGPGSSAVTIDAVVGPAPGTGILATGTVSITHNGTTTTASLVGGRASLAVDPWAAGSHSVSVTYSGDANYLPTSAAPRFAAIATMTSSLSFAGLRVAVNLSGDPAATWIPMGTVTLYDGDVVVGTAPAGWGGASFTSLPLAVGAHNLSATYSGDGQYAWARTSPLHTPGLGLSTSVARSTFGGSVDLTATAPVDPATGTCLSGDVTFSDGTTVVGRQTLVGCRATFTLRGLSVGTHVLIAQVAGAAPLLPTANFSVHTVDRATPYVVPTATPSTIHGGEPITLAAKVSSDRWFGLPPTGTIALSIGATTFAVLPIVNGQVQHTGTPSPTAAAGAYKVAVGYSGDDHYAPVTTTLWFNVAPQLAITPFSGTGPRVAVLGDSISGLSQAAVMPALVDAGYTASVTGLFGYNTQTIAPYADLYAPTDPAVMIIEVGTNDVSAMTYGMTGFSFEDYKTRMLSLAAKFPRACLAVTTVSSHVRLDRLTPNPPVWNANASLVNQWLHATFTNVVEWDQTVYDARLQGAELMLADDVHPGPVGSLTLASLYRRAADRCLTTPH